MIEIGRIVVKKKGREAGRKAVIVAVKKGAPIVEGKHVRRRACSPKHLFFTKEKVKLSKDAARTEILKALGEKEAKKRKEKKTKKEEKKKKARKTRKTKEEKEKKTKIKAKKDKKTPKKEKKIKTKAAAKKAKKPEKTKKAGKVKK